MNENEWKNAFWPEFSGELAAMLVRGRSINLVGARGCGKTRMLEDLKELHSGHEVILLNMKLYRNHYQGFIAELGKMSGFTGRASLGKIIDHLEAKEQKVWLLLDNFHALFNNPEIDPGYDHVFFSSLNGFKNNPKFALLLATEKKHSDYVLHIGGKEESSPLDLEIKHQPTLTGAVVRNALSAAPKLTDQNNVVQFLVEKITAHACPYALLQYILQDRLLGDPISANGYQKQIDGWIAEFDRTSLDKGMHIVKGKGKHLVKVSGISGLKPSFVQKMFGAILKLLGKGP